MFYYNFLHQYLNRGFAKNGITLPFLYGIHDDKLTIREFINEIDSLDENLYISVQYCSEIKEYVFGVFNDEGDLTHYNKFTSLILLDDDIPTDYDEFIAKMEKLYQDKLNAFTYSKKNGDWFTYSILESEKIELCLNN